MTFPLDSLTTTNVKQEMICAIVHARTNRKDDISMQKRVFIDEVNGIFGKELHDII